MLLGVRLALEPLRPTATAVAVPRGPIWLASPSRRPRM
ncbi:hypothetical protein ACP70R_030674 [Stipagrostis hirtigluma subsp. patula]